MVLQFDRMSASLDLDSFGTFALLELSDLYGYACEAGYLT